jgi:hypothetical protein
METKMRMNDMMQLAIAREWNVQTERIIKNYISYTDACIADLEAQNAKLLEEKQAALDLAHEFENVTDQAMADRARLLEALKPFAAMGDVIRPTVDNNDPIYGYDDVMLTRADFERAAVLLAELGKSETAERIED